VNPRKAHVGPYHLSRVEMGEELTRINDDLPNIDLFIESTQREIVEVVQLLQKFKSTFDMLVKKKKVVTMKDASYTLTDGILYKTFPDDILNMCALKNERIHY
jgi:hypothetical protein